MRHSNVGQVLQNVYLCMLPILLKMIVPPIILLNTLVQIPLRSKQVTLITRVQHVCLSFADIIFSFTCPILLEVVVTASTYHNHADSNHFLI